MADAPFIRTLTERRSHVEAHWVGRVFTSDTNGESAPRLGDQSADAYTLVAFEQDLGNWKLGQITRVDNFFNDMWAR